MADLDAWDDQDSATSLLALERRALIHFVLQRAGDSVTLPRRADAHLDADLTMAECQRLRVDSLLECLREGRKLDLNNPAFFRGSAWGEDDFSMDRLSERQLQLCSYECVLLCTDLKGKQDAHMARDSDSLRTLRTNLDITSGTRKRLFAALRTPSAWPTQSLMYRVDALCARRPRDFHTDAEFEQWVERQVWVIFHGVKAMLERVSAVAERKAGAHGASATVAEEATRLEALVARVKDAALTCWDVAHTQQGRIRKRASEPFPEARYAAAVAALAELVSTDVRGAVPSDFPITTKGVEYAFPLNVTMYVGILRGMFGDGAGSNDDQLIVDEEAVIDALTPVRLGMGITQRLHDIGFLSTCFERYKRLAAVPALALFCNRLIELGKKDGGHPSADAVGEARDTVWGADAETGLASQVGTYLQGEVRCEIVGSFSALLSPTMARERHLLLQAHKNLVEQFDLPAPRVATVPAATAASGAGGGPIHDPYTTHLIALVQDAATALYTRVTRFARRPMEGPSIVEAVKALRAEMEDGDGVGLVTLVGRAKEFGTAYSSAFVDAVIACMHAELRATTVEIMAADAPIAVLSLDDLAAATGPNAGAGAPVSSSDADPSSLVGSVMSVNFVAAVAAMQTFESAFRVSALGPRPNLAALLNDAVSCRVATSLHSWIEHLRKAFAFLMGRILSADSWCPVFADVRHSSSPVDVFTMLAQAFEILFGLRVPLPTVFNGLVQEAVHCVVSYSVAIKALMGSPSDYVPKPPKIRKPRRGSRDRIPQYVHDECFTAPVEEILTREHSFGSMLVMLNDLHVAIQKTDALWFSAKTTWNDICSSAGCPCSTTVMDQLKVALLHSLNVNADDGLDTVAARAVCFEMREVFLAGLYVPSVREARVESVLAVMAQSLLPLVADTLMQEIAKPTVIAIARLSFDVWERVVFNGGMHRVYDPSDATMLGEDLTQLHDFFAPSDGGGLEPEAFVDDLTRLRSSLVLLQMPTAQLVSIYQQNKANAAPKPGNAGGMIKNLMPKGKGKASASADPRAAGGTGAGAGGLSTHEAARRMVSKTDRHDPFSNKNMRKVLGHREDKAALALMKSEVVDFDTSVIARPVMDVIDLSSRFSEIVKNAPSRLTGDDSARQKEAFGLMTRSASGERGMRASNVGTGLFRGLKSFGTEVFVGVVGVVREPMQGAEREGAVGFFKGIGRGLGGVALRPIAGAIDLVTMTSEGLMNTPGNIVDAAASAAQAGRNRLGPGRGKGPR